MKIDLTFLLSYFLQGVSNFCFENLVHLKKVGVVRVWQLPAHCHHQKNCPPEKNLQEKNKLITLKIK
jgi:hypothetical protein